MSSLWQAVFFGFAFALAALYAVLEGFGAAALPNRKWMPSAALALFVFVFFVIALRAA